jgi:hypothetical protein
MEGPDDRLSLLWRRLPSTFEIRVAAVAPGGKRRYAEDDWRDALVVIERGELELESLGGTRRRFGRGGVLWLVGLPLRALHNRGRETAVLVAVSRRRPAVQAGCPAGCGSATSTVSAGAFSRLDSARNGSARAEIPAPIRYDGA